MYQVLFEKLKQELCFQKKTKKLKKNMFDRQKHNILSRGLYSLSIFQNKNPFPSDGHQLFTTSFLYLYLIKAIHYRLDCIL